MNCLILVGLASGIATYSYLTAVWAVADCNETDTECIPDLPRALRILAFCMVGHSLAATILLSVPHQHLNAEDISHLQSNLLNLQRSEYAAND